MQMQNLNILLQYAIMGSVYAEKVRGIEKPRVGLLNIGTEEKKGNELTKDAFELLKQSRRSSFYRECGST